MIRKILVTITAMAAVVLLVAVMTAGAVLGAVSLGLLWAVMTIGVYITYRILDIADLTVEGSIALGAAIASRAISGGMNPYLSLMISLLGGMLAGLATGLLHTKLKFRRSCPAYDNDRTILINLRVRAGEYFC